MVNIADKTVKLQIWDTAGLENFQALTTSYYRGANAALLVFDISKRVTFTSIPFWLEQVRQNAGSPPDVQIMLV